MEKARTGRGIEQRALALAKWLMSGWEGVVLCIGPYGEPFLYVDPEHHLVERGRAGERS